MERGRKKRKRKWREQNSKGIKFGMNIGQKKNYKETQKMSRK